MKLTKLLYSFLLLFLVAIVLDWVWGGKGFQQIFGKNEIFMEKVGEVAALQKQNEKLEQENAALRKSSFMLEKVAREEFGMAEPGEKVYFIKSSSKNKHITKNSLGIK